MGSWFSNLHIRKHNLITEAAVTEYICKAMVAKQYMPVASENEADCGFAIVTDENSQWYSVYSELFPFDEPEQFADYATAMSEELKTDILGISCFDSDYLSLQLIDAAKKVDAWAGIGSAAGLGIRKRTKLSAWKNKVSDFEAFQQSVKKKYVFAEEVLGEIEACICLPQNLGLASYEYLSDLELSGQATYLYFKLPESMKTQDPPKLVQYMPSLMPCFLEKPSIVGGINTGGASKGISVYFVGPYVENEEITFSDVSFVKWKNNQAEAVPFELKKVQLSDGQWAYYYHDPGFKIFPKVDERIPAAKRMRVQSERSIIVRFVPHGDPRKILDISVVIVPDKNPQGQTGWNVWHQFGSKKEYIRFHNSNWSEHPNCEHLLLREEDYCD